MRTSMVVVRVSAFDPKRTSDEAASRPCLLCLYVSELDYLGPLAGFVDNEFGEIAR